VGLPAIGRHDVTAPRWALAVTCVAGFMVGLDALVVTTALPAIGADLRAGLDTRQWIVSAYVLAYAVGIVPAAALGDRVGRRRVFTLGLLLFAVASAGCALAAGPAALLAARALQGLGAATVMPLSLTILGGAFPPERRGAVLGIWGGVGGLAVATGPLVGALLTAASSWHAIFWVNVPVGLVCAALAVRRLPESHGEPAPLDVPGMALVAGGVLAIAWGLTGSAGPADRGRMVSALVAGVALVAGFAVRQRRGSSALLPPRLVRAPGFAAANATAVLLTATINAATFLVAQFFQEAQHAEPVQAGLRLLPWTLTPLVVAPLAGTFADRVGRRPVLAAGMLAQGLGLGWFALAAGPDAGYPALAGALLLAGVGISMALPTSAGAALAVAAPRDLGRASGATSTLQRLGAGLGISVTASVFAATGSLAGPAAFSAGFRPALAVAAGLSLMGASTALAVDRPRRRPVSVPAEVTREPALASP
jgi:EmrB/QacA subfamily drug resistance transporter